MRKKLLQLGKLDNSLKIRREGDMVILPILFPVLEDLGVDQRYDVAEGNFEERSSPEGDYRKNVKIPGQLIRFLPTSFDVVGDIAIVRLPEEMISYKIAIGEALVSTFPRLRTIAIDKGVRGEVRIRDLEVISGDDSTETVHVEYGLRLKVDLRKAYFNPRLASERHRVASQVRKGEIIIDMFAGVGPFSMMIAKYAEPKIVYAIDLNMDAVEYLKNNIMLNRVKNVVPILGDAREILPTLPRPDRMIMNLPHSAREFLPDALQRLRSGGTIHFYFVCERSSGKETISAVESQAQELGKSIVVSRMEELKTYSPSSSVFSADIVLVDGG
jgi:tRNA (guanine37-N1)-methyltransferase